MFHITIFWPNERLLELFQFSYLFVFFSLSSSVNEKTYLGRDNFFKEKI